MGRLFLDCPDETKVITRVLIRGRQEGYDEKKRSDERSRGLSVTIARRGHEQRIEKHL